jgi:hypothetical protein
MSSSSNDRPVSGVARLEGKRRPRAGPPRPRRPSASRALANQRVPHHADRQRSVIARDHCKNRSGGSPFDACDGTHSPPMTCGECLDSRRRTNGATTASNPVTVSRTEAGTLGVVPRLGLGDLAQAVEPQRRVTGGVSACVNPMVWTSPNIGVRGGSDAVVTTSMDTDCRPVPRLHAGARRGIVRGSDRSSVAFGSPDAELIGCARVEVP